MKNEMNTAIKKDLLAFLLQFITPNKQGLFTKTLNLRTRHLTVVMEDIFQPHNASAVLRSCDCFGIQDVHIIENRNQYEVNPDVAVGSAKWLNIYKYRSEEQDTVQTFDKLRDQGYTIAATTPHKNDYLIDELPLKNKTALVFGTELNGLSEIALNNADIFVKIPMYGFTESYNISVSAAIILYELTKRLRASSYPWQLNEEEALDIHLMWAKKVVKKADELERVFYQQKKN